MNGKVLDLRLTKEIKKLEDQMEKSKNDLLFNKDFKFKPYCRGDKLKIMKLEKLVWV
jgi:hypothetical protein